MAADTWSKEWDEEVEDSTENKEASTTEFGSSH